MFTVIERFIISIPVRCTYTRTFFWNVSKKIEISPRSFLFVKLISFIVYLCFYSVGLLMLMRRWKTKHFTQITTLFILKLNININITYFKNVKVHIYRSLLQMNRFPSECFPEYRQRHFPYAPVIEIKTNIQITISHYFISKLIFNVFLQQVRNKRAYSQTSFFNECSSDFQYVHENRR